MQGKRPVGPKKGNVPRKKIPAGTLIANMRRQGAEQPEVKYPSVFENMRQNALRQERLSGTKKKMRSAGGLRGATSNTPTANFRPKLFGRGAAATRQGLRWDARSAAQPREQEPEDKSRSRKRLRR